MYYVHYGFQDVGMGLHFISTSGASMGGFLLPTGQFQAGPLRSYRNRMFIHFLEHGRS